MIILTDWRSGYDVYIAQWPSAGYNSPSQPEDGDDLALGNQTMVGFSTKIVRHPHVNKRAACVRQTP